MNGDNAIAGRSSSSARSRASMGEVHRARDLQTGDTVPVKLTWRRRTGEEVSLTEADKNAARFMREVRIMSRLSSPNLPRTIAGGIDGDRPGHHCVGNRAGTNSLTTASGPSRCRRCHTRERAPSSVRSSLR